MMKFTLNRKRKVLIIEHIPCSKNPEDRMAKASVHQLALFMFLFLVASGFMQQAFAVNGGQCKANKDCGRYCQHRPSCPTLCLNGYCLCNCDSTKMDQKHNKPF
uniref:Uncharacterized protein n=1 Tax=Phaseolus vulgaris TaxID=3885 RepID=V7BTS4_PHAVU|nr:hypothetical protein PHAVU_006G169800g [Phaseolus vulgaris]ESW19966.1 hypothetical protein PHAVU_006G169800g [Phaseolus vulgaris]